MKKNTLSALLASGCTLAGVLCMAIRQWLLTAATDGKGLLQAGHPGAAVSWILTGLVLLALAAATLYSMPRCSFQESPLTLVGNGIQAVALGVLAAQLLRTGDGLSLITAIAAVAAALCCLANAVCRVCSLRYKPLLRCPLVIFYLLFLVFCYQSWSSEPELQRYGFQLLALVCLTLAAYHRAALAMKLGSSRMYLFAANAAVFLCLAAVPGGAHSLFFLLMAVATVLDGCTVKSSREA